VPLLFLLSQQPNSFYGLETIDKFFFFLKIVLFFAFCALISTRFILKPQAITTPLYHQQERFFLGTFLFSLALILYCKEQYGVPSCGPWLIKPEKSTFGSMLHGRFWSASSNAISSLIWRDCL
jgi:tellurite resistance protein TehA-like permease